MGEVKHVTKDGVIIYTDGSEIGIEQITTRAIETGDDVSPKKAAIPAGTRILSIQTSADR